MIYNPKELKYYGLHACLAIWKKRPNDIIRLYLDPALLKHCKPLLKWCAENKRAYHLIDPTELEKVSESVHHEGICLLAKKPMLSSPATATSGCLIYLDGVQNPHNLGAILRSAAHFGTLGVVGEKKILPALSPSCCRIAQGGAEEVSLMPLDQPLSWLKEKRYALIATSSHKGEDLYNFRFPPRSALILGSESEGISKKLLSQADHLIRVPGTGAVESLNVSVATALCLSEYYRQHQL
jgi:TrmH RNA methyltransferase